MNDIWKYVQATCYARCKIICEWVTKSVSYGIWELPNMWTVPYVSFAICEQQNMYVNIKCDMQPLWYVRYSICDVRDMWALLYVSSGICELLDMWAPRYVSSAICELRDCWGWTGAPDATQGMELAPHPYFRYQQYSINALKSILKNTIQNHHHQRHHHFLFASNEPSSYSSIASSGINGQWYGMECLNLPKPKPSH